MGKTWNIVGILVLAAALAFVIYVVSRGGGESPRPSGSGSKKLAVAEKESSAGSKPEVEKKGVQKPQETAKTQENTAEIRNPPPPLIEPPQPIVPVVSEEKEKAGPKKAGVEPQERLGPAPPPEVKETGTETEKVSEVAKEKSRALESTSEGKAKVEEALKSPEKKVTEKVASEKEENLEKATKPELLQPVEPQPVKAVGPLGQAEKDFITYVVKEGDSLWTIAVELLGDGRRWKDILKLNPDLPQDGTGLQVGKIIKVPRISPKPEEEVSPLKTYPYTIKAGDTLASIAKKFYGTETVWLQILAANPGLDPDALPVGKKIKLPEIDGKKPEGMPEGIKESEE